MSNSPWAYHNRTCSPRAEAEQVEAPSPGMDVIGLAGGTSQSDAQTGTSGAMTAGLDFSRPRRSGLGGSMTAIEP